MTRLRASARLPMRVAAPVSLMLAFGCSGAAPKPASEPSPSAIQHDVTPREDEQDGAPHSEAPKDLGDPAAQPVEHVEPDGPHTPPVPDACTPRGTLVAEAYFGSKHDEVGYSSEGTDEWGPTSFQVTPDEKHVYLLDAVKGRLLRFSIGASPSKPAVAMRMNHRARDFQLMSDGRVGDKGETRLWQRQKPRGRAHPGLCGKRHP
jgi:hypothetical protein